MKLLNVESICAISTKLYELIARSATLNSTFAPNDHHTLLATSFLLNICLFSHPSIHLNIHQKFKPIIRHKSLSYRMKKGRTSSNIYFGSYVGCNQPLKIVLLLGIYLRSPNIKFHRRSISISTQKNKDSRGSSRSKKIK